jgi:hypothetical protein
MEEKTYNSNKKGICRKGGQGSYTVRPKRKQAIISINTACAWNSVFLNIKESGKYSNYRALKS